MFKYTLIQIQPIIYLYPSTEKQCKTEEDFIFCTADGKCTLVENSDGKCVISAPNIKRFCCHSCFF